MHKKKKPRPRHRILTTDYGVEIYTADEDGRFIDGIDNIDYKEGEEAVKNQIRNWHETFGGFNLEEALDDATDGNGVNYELFAEGVAEPTKRQWMQSNEDYWQEQRRKAWVRFACSPMVAEMAPGTAALTADKMLEEFDKRFSNATEGTDEEADA